jgi:hypothetical protein
LIPKKKFFSHSGENGGSHGIKISPKKTKLAEYKIQKAKENGGVHAVPEPATIILVGNGLAGLAIFRRKFKKKSFVPKDSPLVNIL